MTNDQQTLLVKTQSGRGLRPLSLVLGHCLDIPESIRGWVIRHSFVIRHSSFVINPWFLVLASLVLGHLALAQDSGPSERQVKAAYLVNFPKYVDWPAGAFQGSTAPVVIGILGEDNLSAELKKMTEGKTVNGRGYAVKHLHISQLSREHCHILFISNSEKQDLPDIFAKLKGASVLTVGETESFRAQGGIIIFANQDRKVRLKINLEAAEQARLKISSKLLGVAEVMKGKNL